VIIWPTGLKPGADGFGERQSPCKFLLRFPIQFDTLEVVDKGVIF